MQDEILCFHDFTVNEMNNEASMPEEPSSQMTELAFPLWLLNNTHTSFTLIKMTVLFTHLPLLSLSPFFFSLLCCFCFCSLFPLSHYLISLSSWSRPLHFTSLSTLYSSLSSSTLLLTVFPSLAQARSSPLHHVSFVSLYPAVRVGPQWNIFLGK